MKHRPTIAPSLADAYIAGWRTCRRQPTPLTDPNRLSPDRVEAWATGFHDALIAPHSPYPDPHEAGYAD